MSRVTAVLLTLLALPFALAGLVLAAGALATLVITLRVGAANPPAGRLGRQLPCPSLAEMDGSALTCWCATA